MLSVTRDDVARRLAETLHSAREIDFHLALFDNLSAYCVHLDWWEDHKRFAEEQIAKWESSIYEHVQEYCKHPIKEENYCILCGKVD